MFSGNIHGSVSVTSTSSYEILHRFHFNKSHICGLSLFQNLKQVNYFAVIGWDNLMNLVDLRTKSVVSDVKLNL